jgi:2,5-furandicarboxylate decarboxylase 1
LGQSLRGFLRELESTGDLRRIAEPVSLRYAWDVNGIQERILDALATPIAPREIAGAPCQEVVVETPDLAQLPIPWFFEYESGPYITAGAIVARDLEDGGANLSIARLKPLGGARAMAGIAL